MTTFQHPESPYKSDHTASGKAGFTLMNNQVGAVIAAHDPASLLVAGFILTAGQPVAHVRIPLVP